MTDNDNNTGWDNTMWVDRDTYAARIGVTPRRVADYLRLGELPTARKDERGKWWIPEGAVRVANPGAAAVVSVRNRIAGAGAALDVVAAPPVAPIPRGPHLITLDEAATRYGTTRGGIRRMAADGVVRAGKWGRGAAWAVLVDE
jgi:hypothetical protein